MTVRTEPRTFNRYSARDQVTEALALLTQAKLVRINRASQEVEPWLANRWTVSPDGLTYTLSLRPEIVWSDGQPFTADDVVFSFQAVYDAKSASPLADNLTIAGRPLTLRAVDARTVVITFPAPWGPGIRVLDNLPILPRHKLDAALKAGTFAKAWDLSTPPSEIVGLGPFVVQAYEPGQRLVFARNPHYWRTDARGIRLPYLDRITFDIVPDQNTEVLRLEAGQSDTTLTEITAEHYATVKSAADRGALRLLDLGVGLDADSFWINLTPDAFKNDPRASWLQRDELRQAISLAIDRQAFADTVLLGAGVPVFGPITPANRKWYDSGVVSTAHDSEKAKALLASIGLADRNRDGLLEDPGGRPAHFTVVTSKGATTLEKGAEVLRDQLKSIGLTLDVVPLDNSAVIQRFLTGKYEAVYFPLLPTDTDPASQLDFWLSSGSAHVWDIGQKAPATDWERRIDELMSKQSATIGEGERVRLFAEVQRIFGEHQPALYFVAPKVFVATTTRVNGVVPAVQRPQTLWSADTISVGGLARETR